MTFDYKGWLNTAEQRLAQLKEQRNAIDEEIAKLESGIKAFAPLVEDSVLHPELGLTDTIRQVFIESGEGAVLAPTGIRDALVRRGLALKQTNPMAAIHQTLARLMDKDFLEEVPYQGQKYYRWTGQMNLSDSVRLAASNLTSSATSIVNALGEANVLHDMHGLDIDAIADPIVKEGKKKK